MRYGLASTTPPSDGRWWNTTSSLTDLIHYYDMLLSGSGGLPAVGAMTIVNDLARSTPTGADGYPQRFGIPDGLFAEPVAVKQGWMCCIGTDWVHLSTGVIVLDKATHLVIANAGASRILGKELRTTEFSQHLERLADAARGNVLQKQGAGRTSRFRFVNPLLQPYVAMRGVSEGVVKVQELS